MLFELTLTILKLLVQLKMYNNLNCHLFILFVNYLNCFSIFFYLLFLRGKWKSASYLTQKLDIEIGSKRKHKLYYLYVIVYNKETMCEPHGTMYAYFCFVKLPNDGR